MTITAGEYSAQVSHGDSNGAWAEITSNGTHVASAVFMRSEGSFGLGLFDVDGCRNEHLPDDILEVLADEINFQLTTEVRQ